MTLVNQKKKRGCFKFDRQQLKEKKGGGGGIYNVEFRENQRCPATKMGRRYQIHLKMNFQYSSDEINGK